MMSISKQDVDLQLLSNNNSIAGSASQHMSFDFIT